MGPFKEASTAATASTSCGSLGKKPWLARRASAAPFASSTPAALPGRGTNTATKSTTSSRRLSRSQVQALCPAEHHRSNLSLELNITLGYTPSSVTSMQLGAVSHVVLVPGEVSVKLPTIYMVDTFVFNR